MGSLTAVAYFWLEPVGRPILWLEPAGRPMRPPPPARPIRRNRRANVLMPPGVTALPARDPPASYRL